MGKSKCPVWQYIIVIKKKMKKTVYQCVFCLFTIAKNATQMIERIKNCSKCPRTVKNTFGKSGSTKEGKINSNLQRKCNKKRRKS